MTNPHGGARPGAGRPRGATTGAAKRKARMIQLSDEEYRVVREFGEGNASAGVRLAIKTASTVITHPQTQDD